MWTIERREETDGKRATRWVPVPGVRCGTREEAAAAAREAVLGELRQERPALRTHRYRIAALAVACMVLQ